MKAEIMEVVTLGDLPTLVRIARRGRPVETLEAETGLSHATLRKAERGDTVELWTVMKIAAWTAHAVVIQPEDLERLELELHRNAAGEELGLDDSAP